MSVRNFASLPTYLRLVGVFSLIALVIALPVIITAFFVQKHQEIGTHAPAALNPVQVENARPGDTSWQIIQPSAHGEIQAYTGNDSINAGGSVDLYVSTKVPDTYRIDIYRLGDYNGKGGRLLQTLPDHPAIPQGYYPVSGSRPPAPINCPTCITNLKDSKGQETNITDANWKVSTTLTFSPEWISGIYEIKLTESQGYQWLVPLVVRDDGRKADLAFQDPLNTDQAYNEWGGTSFYRNYRSYGPTGEPADGTPPYWAFYLSYNRPYLLENGAGNLFAWTYPMIRFLEQRGYDVTYTTNNAVAEGFTKLTHYKGFLTAGHDEYVSLPERQKIEQAVANGVSIAYFGANNMYWQTRSLPDREGHADRIMVEYKDYYGSFDPYDSPANPNRNLTTALWRGEPINNPEDRLLKAMSPFGAACACSSNFVAINTNSWVYNHTGLKDGDQIPGILGTEIDSVFLNDGSITRDDTITIIGQSPFKAADGTRFTANAVLNEFGTNDYIIVAGQSPYEPGLHNITFDAGTIFWTHGLSTFRASSATPESHALEQMTDNILQRMIDSGGDHI